MYSSIYYAYFIFLAFIFFIGLSMVFHIARFSIKKSGAAFILMLFLPVFAALIFSNIVYFLQIPFEQVIP